MFYHFLSFFLFLRLIDPSGYLISKPYFLIALVVYLIVHSVSDLRSLFQKCLKTRHQQVTTSSSTVSHATLLNVDDIFNFDCRPSQIFRVGTTTCTPALFSCLLITSSTSPTSSQTCPPAIHMGATTPPSAPTTASTASRPSSEDQQKPSMVQLEPGLTPASWWDYAGSLSGSARLPDQDIGAATSSTSSDTGNRSLRTRRSHGCGECSSVGLDIAEEADLPKEDKSTPPIIESL